MYPWYQEYHPGYKLPYDDVAGIQSLYGRYTFIMLNNMEILIPQKWTQFH